MTGTKKFYLLGFNEIKASFQSIDWPLKRRTGQPWES